LTTGATIWAVAAVGVAVGSGYVAAGLGFTLLILGTLTVMQHVENVISGGCRFQRARVAYRSEQGKTRPRLQSILDRYRVPDDAVTHGEGGPDECWLEARVCVAHREHRDVLRELAEIDPVRSLDVK
jgi:putative Mg2+ transporter-C (MgtC) family protein